MVGGERRPTIGLRFLGGVCFLPAVLSRGIFLRYWLPAILWMALIFIGSSDVFSSRHTSAFLVPLIQWLGPDLTAAQVDKIQFAVRKAGHLGEFAILGILVWRALRFTNGLPAPVWSWRDAGWALLIAAGYAASDELHQLFVASRWASIRDVLLDSAGAALGLLAAFVVVWSRQLGREEACIKSR
jgi:VanZ family protein